MDDDKVKESDGLVLYWLFRVNISLFVEDSIGTEGTLDCIIRFKFGFLSAFYLSKQILLFPQT